MMMLMQTTQLPSVLASIVNDPVNPVLMEITYGK